MVGKALTEELFDEFCQQSQDDEEILAKVFAYFRDPVSHAARATEVRLEIERGEGVEGKQARWATLNLVVRQARIPVYVAAVYDHEHGPGATAEVNLLRLFVEKLRPLLEAER